MPKNNSQLISFAAMAGALALLYGLDRLTIIWRRQARASFQLGPFFLYTVLAEVLFAALMLFLAWLLLVRIRQGPAMRIVVVLVGALMTGFALLLVSGRPAMLPIINLPFMAWLRIAMLELATASLTFQAGAFILVIGLISLLRRQR